MGSLHLAVELWCPWLDGDVPDPLVGEMPTKLGLELVSAVGPDGMNPEGEFLDHVVDEADRILLRMSLVDLECSDARSIIDGRLLVAASRVAVLSDEFQERDVAGFPDIPDSFSVLQDPLLTERIPLRIVHDQPPDSGPQYSYYVSSEVGNSYNSDVIPAYDNIQRQYQ
jgi:hypothetical protein